MIKMGWGGGIQTAETGLNTFVKLKYGAFSIQSIK